ncbi:MAG: hypothetical protein IJ344_03115 [Clostridia bacterium]|nr:hypothetical protein [Clostridia bacterium]
METRLNNLWSCKTTPKKGFQDFPKIFDGGKNTIAAKFFYFPLTPTANASLPHSKFFGILKTFFSKKVLSGVSG